MLRMLRREFWRYSDAYVIATLTMAICITGLGIIRWHIDQRVIHSGEQHVFESRFVFER